jgi:hypothetical protein
MRRAAFQRQLRSCRQRSDEALNSELILLSGLKVIKVDRNSRGGRTLRRTGRLNAEQVNAGDGWNRIEKLPKLGANG